MTFSSVHHNKVHFLEEDFLWVEALLKLETKKTTVHQNEEIQYFSNFWQMLCYFVPHIRDINIHNLSSPTCSICTTDSLRIVSTFEPNLII